MGWVGKIVVFFWVGGGGGGVGWRGRHARVPSETKMYGCW